MKIAAGVSRKYAALFLAGLGAWVLNTLAISVEGMAMDVACAALPVVWLALAAWLRVRGCWTARALTSLILVGGFLVGLCFILRLPYNFSWHDLASYSADFSGAAKPDGHLGYIAWIVENGTLPSMDPRVEGYSVFYNPPLYHLIQAGFMRLNLWLKVPETVALENLQVVTLMFASACPLVAVDLMRFLGISERGVRIGALVMAFQPSLWILGATLNNDILSILCILACILFTVRWERTRRMRDILGGAFSLGAGMAAKLSTALLIPCVALVFIVAFFRDVKRWRRYVGQFLAFLGASVPLAVAWPLYHLLVFDMPLNYVRLPAETIYVGHLSLWKRFGIPDWFARRELFYTGVRKTDHNVWMQTFKTGVFDELTLFEKGSTMWYVAYLLMALFAALLLVELILFVHTLIKRPEGISGLAATFLGMYAAVLAAYYIKFCLDYPYICSFNFRYIVPVLLLAALGAAFWRDRARRSGWLVFATGMFAALGVAVYGIWFFFPGKLIG
ncbi:MAG: glycosyltransferase family 39 protein [Candidatus Limiplasma sp.]|nr:glycosyltransferase family 39 protein [Candidatus Limiplasma sp.]